MKIDVREIYADDDWGWYDYHPMLNAFGNIVIQVDESGYQGDSWLLYDEKDKIGYLTFGWGSCSGCDALQSCGTLEDVQRVCDSLQDSIKWFDNKTQALEWFNAHDWEGDYCWYLDEAKKFVKKCIEYLSADTPTEKGGE